MKTNFTRILGILLTVFMIATMLPSVVLADAVALQDSPNYFKVVSDDGKIKEYLYHDTITEGGKTYIGIIGAYDVYDWNAGLRGPSFRSIQGSGVDFEGKALPVDANWYVSSNMSTNWGSNQYTEIHQYMSWIPTSVQDYLLKYSYDCGRNNLYDNYTSHNIRTISKLTFVSRDELEAHSQYLVAASKTINADTGYVTTRTGNVSGYYRYNKSTGGWSSADTFAAPYGSAFVRMYVDANMLKEVKLDTIVMGANIKNMLLNSGATWEELRAVGYSSAELVSLGFTEPVIPVTGVTLDKTSHTMTINETVQLKADVLPLNQVADDSVTWTTDDDTVATVVDGLVTAVGFGTTTITATSNADNNFSDTCTITVSYIDVEEVILDKESIDLNVDTSQYLNVTVKPSNASFPEITWTSDNEAVATVDQNGQVTAVSAGVAVITAKSDDDETKFDTCEVRVIRGPVDSPNYIEVIADDGTIKEYLYNDTITLNGKTYIGLIGAYDIYDWDRGFTGPNFRAISSGVDFEGDALPSDSYNYLSTNLTKQWNCTMYDEIHTKISMIPTCMQGYLLKYVYDCGSYSSKLTKTVSKITITSKDEIETHKKYLLPIMKTTGSYSGYITTRTGHGGDGYYRYEKSTNKWLTGNTFEYPYGSTSVRMYVDADMFKAVKINLNTMGSEVKSVFAANFVKSDLSGIYTEPELEKMGIPDDYVLEVTNTPLLTKNMSIEYKFTNYNKNTVNAPVILAVAYDNKGNVVGAKHIVPGNGATVGTAPAISTVEITSAEVPAYAVVYALKNLQDATPLTKRVVIGTEYNSNPIASADSANISYALNADETTAAFTVSGTLADGISKEFVAIVTKPGKTLADLATATDTTSVILNVKQSLTSAEGKYAYDFTVDTDNLAYDIYSLNVYYGATSPATDTVVYSDSGFDTVVAADFASMTMSAFIAKYSSVLPMDTTLAGLLTADELAVAKAAVVTTNATATGIADDINSQMATQYVKKVATGTDVANVIATYNKYIGLVFDGLLNTLSPDHKTKLYDMLAADTGLESTSKLVEAYEKGVMLIKINSITRYDDIEYILLTDYPAEATKYGLDLTKFTTYGSDLPKAMARLINEKPFDTWADFKASYVAYSGESEGNGGGGGGGGGVSPTTKPVDPTTLVQFTPDIVTNVQNETAIFDDLGEAKWAAPYIESLAKLGYVNGKNAKNFCPNDNITREEVIKILVSALNLDLSSTKNVFVDANPEAWYTPYLIAAYENGITNGSGDGRFGVGANITREELATMIFRASKMVVSSTDVEFADETEISDWANEAVTSLTAAGVLNGKGDNLFAPKANATRAEAAKIIYLAIVGK